MKDKLLIIGASGHGKVVADIALKMNKWNKIAFLDDNENIKLILGLEILGKSTEVLKYIDEYDIFVGIGNNAIREKMQEKLGSFNASIATLIHPSVVIGVDVTIGAGTAVMAGSIINPSTEIGKGCIINTGATVDHDNLIKDYVHISPGAHLAGTVTIGQGSWLGIGSVIRNNVDITNRCIIGAGTVVVKSITEPGTYIGVPARRV